LYFKSILKVEIRESISARDLAVFRLVDMFIACTRLDIKEAILSAFRSLSGILRNVVATVAFGMGLDCPNVRQIIHWGPSSGIEQYCKRQDEQKEMVYLHVQYCTQWI